MVDSCVSVAPALRTGEGKPGGDTTVGIRPRASFMLPARNLATDQLPDFHAGKALAHQPWVEPPTTTDARDGLGPLYNARACLSCHLNGGRGHIPDDKESYLVNGVVRVSVPGFDAVHGAIPEPMYGNQLQSQSVALSHQFRGQTGADKHAAKDVVPEALAYITWIVGDVTYPDGEHISLRHPQIELRAMGYGDLHVNTLMSLRSAPPILGAGLLDMIGQQDIDRLADEADENRDGISGRVNMTWDQETGQPRPGRFGWKANRPSVRLQVAAALQGDMGISNPIFPEQPCSARQTRCNNSVHGTDEQGVEISVELFNLLVNFNMSLGVPERRKPDHPLVLQGRELFYQTGCQACHHPSYVTQTRGDYPHLSEQQIWPYTDLLLHDMGDALADGRPDYLAGGSEWRTPPLWGVGLSQAVNGTKQYLHDGRARTVEEAIVWHGGEAEAAKNTFTHLDREQRKALTSFVKSL